MEQRFINLSRNYSRKEGGEMFSLTMGRELEIESTHNRQRIESYLLFYDVEIQILEEILAFDYVTVDFLKGRQKLIANTVNALLNKLYIEMASGELTAFQIGLNEETIDRAYERLAKFLPERREVVSVAKVEEVEREVAIEIILPTPSVDPVVVAPETVEVTDTETVEVTEPVTEVVVSELKTVEELAEDVAEKKTLADGEDFLL